MVGQHGWATWLGNMVGQHGWATLFGNMVGQHGMQGSNLQGYFSEVPSFASQDAVLRRVLSLTQPRGVLMKSLLLSYRKLGFIGRSHRLPISDLPALGCWIIFWLTRIGSEAISQQ